MDVEYPGFGEIVIRGQRLDHDVIIEGGVVRARDKGPSRRHPDRRGHTPLTAAEDLPWSGTPLVIGTGASGRLPVLPEVEAEAAARGVELVLLPTADACRMLRGSDDAEVYAVLHLTC
jgi:hypothetical protein